ncbi:ribonuclease H-like domain-containing protein [Aspergillus californicus]
MTQIEKPTIAEILKVPVSSGTQPAKSDSLDINDITTRLSKTKLEPSKKDPLATLISTQDAVAKMLTSLESLPKSPPSLYIDLEGVNLSRHGTISILQIYVYPKDKTYLVDIHTLKDKSFSTTSSSGSGITLKTILENSAIPKVIFDVRNDSDALYAHFKIHLAGIQDLQLMELATRTFRRTLVNGLKRCIDSDTSMTPVQRREWQKTKERGVELFAPEKGGSYEVFNVRPLADEIIEYCVQDVRFLPQLWERYDWKLTAEWRSRVQHEVRNRIVLSQSAGFKGKGAHMALAPSGWDKYGASVLWEHL